MLTSVSKSNFYNMHVYYEYIYFWIFVIMLKLSDLVVVTKKVQWHP